MSQVTAVTLSDGMVVSTFSHPIDGELVARAFTELFAQIQSQATDIAENDAIIDQLRADLAARATAEQPEPATVPYSLYVAGCRDFERVAARCDDAAEIIAALQKALAYWMPTVFDERSAHDAYLLVGYNGENEPAFWDTYPSRDSVIEEWIEETCAAYCIPKPFAIIEAIRALKSQQDAAIESQRSGDGS